MNPFGISSLLVTFSTLAFGFFVYFKGPKRKLNQLWALFYLSVASWGIGGFLISIEKDPHQALLLWRWTLAAVTWIPVSFYRSICELCHLSRPKTLRAYYIIGGISSILYLTTDLYFQGSRYIFGQFYWNVIGPLHPFFMAWWSFVVFHAHYELQRESRQNRGITKSQIKAILFGGVVAYTAGLLEFLPNYHIDLYPWSNFALLFYPAIMTYGIFRYQLFDIQVVIRRSLVYSILVTSLTVGYFGAIYLIEQIFRTRLGYRSPIVSISAFVLMALAFQPLKVGIQRLVDWLLFRAPHEELVKRVERLEQEVLQTEKLKAISTLAAGMAHEIKNPLTALLTFAEFMPEKKNDPAFLEKLQEILSTETRRIHAIVQEVLDFAKPKPPQLKSVEPGLLISSTVNLLSSELLKRHIEWRVNCQHNRATLKADPDQLRQVLINLIQNAADAMPNGGKLTLATNVNNGHLELAISDTGQGIPKDLLPKIFDPFITTKEHGTGLGLAMVHSIVKTHHGSIHASSHPGRGTTFTVRLPV